MRDTENMNQYTAKVAFAEQYLSKLVDWITKKRYQLIEHAMEDHLTLKVDIFTFVLKLEKVSDEEAATSLLAELKTVRQDRQKILRDIKLFNYFFYNVYNEQDFRPRGSNNQHLAKIPQH